MISRLWSAFFAGSNTVLAIMFCAIGRTNATIGFSVVATLCMAAAFITDEDLHEPWRKK